VTYIERHGKKKINERFGGANLFIEQYNKSFRNDSSFERSVDRVLNMAELNFKRSKVIGIYEIDFYLDNGIILELNGDSHFVVN
jgi:very-short-patch-repair endonuclease